MISLSSIKQLEWCPIGETFATATTAPRLRMGNGFKVWHYTGALLHETVWAEGQELLEVVWQKYNEGVCQEKPITNVKVQGIQPSQPQASKAIYVPPNARPGGAMAYSPRSVPVQARGPIPGIPINYKVSQGQLKKQRGSKKKGGYEGTTNGTSPAQNNYAPGAPNGNDHRGPPPNHHGENGDQQYPQRRRPNNRNRERTNSSPTTGDPEKDKRIKVIQKKLKEIVALKARKEKGDNLEANQVSKIGLEIELTQELSSLKIKA